MQADHSHSQGILGAGLACAILERRLRSVLLIGGSPVDVLSTAEIVRRFLKVPESKVLGSTETDEDLWGRVAISTVKPLKNAEKPKLQWHAGRLARQDLTIVAIPDLTRASLACTRAMVALMDSDIAHLECQGTSLVWHPDNFWIAGCTSETIGQVSPHLLDRFALRLRVNALDQLSNQDKVLSNQWIARVGEAATVASLDAEVMVRILDTAGSAEGFRRALALSRLTRACARLAGAEKATVSHFEEAAALIGLHVATKPPDQQLDNNPVEPFGQPVPTSRRSKPRPRFGISGAKQKNALAAVHGATPSAPEQQQVLEAAPIDYSPYPEDQAPVLRDPESLRLPPRKSHNSRAGEGFIIGTQPAQFKRDIAWIATILRASRYQCVRQIGRSKTSALVIHSSDLRSYRRAPVPQRILVLLLDATAINRCRWHEAIRRYLHWAYVERATIHVIQVGVEETPGDGLRARLISGRNLLAPSIVRALEPTPGIATPLAHGLDLALHKMRNCLHNGRSRVDQILFIAITDGRGNVPLAASLQQHLTEDMPTGRRGIEDAFCIAAEIAKLHNLRSVVLHPHLPALKELPIELAVRLNATAEEIMSIEAINS